MTADLNLDGVTERLTRRFGPGVADWCAGIPALARSLASRWAFSPGDPFPGGNSSVAVRGTRSDGSPAVLKLSPDLPVVAEQAETLRLFAPSGRVPAVLAADLAAGAILLELIEPGTQAGALQPPPSARDWASLLAALHTAPVPAGYPTDLRAQCEGFFARIGARVAEPEVGRLVSAADVARGAERCQALLATESTRVLLHGDLHLATVYFSPVSAIRRPEGGPGLRLTGAASACGSAVLRFEKPQAGSLHRESGEAGSGAGGVNLARGPAGALAGLDRVAYPVRPGHPAGTCDDQEQLVPGRGVGPDGPARPHRQAGDGHATAAGGDPGGMQPGTAVRADQTLVAVEAEDLHAYIFHLRRRPVPQPARTPEDKRKSADRPI